MKFNFKKIATVLGSALMIGSTMGLAAAASYPAPFVQSGAANVAVVVGSQAALSDAVAASNIGSDLSTKLAAQTATSGTSSGATASGGDSYKIEKTSTKFQLGKGVLDVISGTVTEDNLPTLLADGKYIDKNNDEYDYTQKVVLANATLSMFDDNDYKSDTPTVGVKMASGDYILNYTISFTDNVPWTTMASTNLKILGKSYYVLSTDANTNMTMTLLDSATSEFLAEGEEKTVSLGGKEYKIAINFVGSNQTKLSVNGVLTNTLSTGQTYKLADGSYVGIKDILYSSKDSGVSKVEFSIGSGKLKLVNNQDIEMNDNTISRLRAFFGGVSAAKVTAITLEWKADGDLFAAPTKDAEMPGFKALKLTYGGMTYPSEETIKIASESDSYLSLQSFPLKDSTETINLLYTTDNSNITGAGKDANNVLRIADMANLSAITFDADTDSYFVASWNDTSSAESYLMRVTNFKTVSGVDKATLQYKKDGSWTSLKEDASNQTTVSIGSTDLTFGDISYTDRTAKIQAGNTAVKFNRLFSKNGLTVKLPVINSTAQTAAGLTAPCTNYTAFVAGQIGPVILNNGTLTTNSTCYETTYALQFNEEDKNGNIGAGSKFNVTIGFNSASTKQIHVSDVVGESVTFAQQQSTKIWESYIYSALASKFLWDKSGDQYSLDIIYHNSESYGNVFLAAPGVTISGTSTTTSGSAKSLGSVTVYDNEAASMSGKNLIVVGGSCVNTVAAQLLGVSYPTCGAAFTSKTTAGDGQFLIQAFTQGTNNVALLVAGYNAADTKKAADYLVNNAVNTTAGASAIVTSTTVANTA